MAIGNDEATTATQPRPSLYAAIKLARLVLFVKERFKARLKSRRQPTEPSTICHRDSLKVRAFKDVNQYAGFAFTQYTNANVVYLELSKPI